ncbi:hypothetical protein [Sphingomonas sp. TREG-RG-20F-R18-01]|uniref:hypothetical protein n=1 Tax=Sphingomonas sp. TREG-RG-20F-R18-01 TaxID=2914982 RepID=UPI001F56792A|nr:hypothetical protein [Sphingomonas sp. TREG-RG-20F-R18-01]
MLYRVSGCCKLGVKTYQGGGSPSSGTGELARRVGITAENDIRRDGGKTYARELMQAAAAQA